MANLGHSLPNSKAGVHYLMTQDCRFITKMHKPFFSPLDFYNNPARTCARLRLRNSALSGFCRSHSSPKPSNQKWHLIKCINKCNCSLSHQMDFAERKPIFKYMFQKYSCNSLLSSSSHFQFVQNLFWLPSPFPPNFPAQEIHNFLQKAVVPRIRRSRSGFVLRLRSAASWIAFTQGPRLLLLLQNASLPKQNCKLHSWGPSEGKPADDLSLVCDLNFHWTCLPKCIPPSNTTLNGRDRDSKVLLSESFPPEAIHGLPYTDTQNLLQTHWQLLHKAPLCSSVGRQKSGFES